MSSAFITCWSHPFDCLASVFGPGYDSSGKYTVGPTDVLAPGDSIGQADKRAQGIDPANGQILIAPQYGPNLASQGVDINNPASIKAFGNKVASEAETLFQKGYDQNLAEIPLLPSLPSLPDFSTPGGAFVGGLVILFFVFIFLWLVSR